MAATRTLRKATEGLSAGISASAEKEPIYYVKTLREVEGKLPVGIQGPTGKDRSYAFKPWKGKDEREVGKALSSGEVRGVDVVMHVLAHFLTRWGPKVFGQDTKPEEKQLALYVSQAGDVLFAWAQLRREVLGDTLTLDLVCDQCRTHFPYNVDVGSIEVLMATDDAILERPIELRDGLSFGGQTCKLLTVAPVRWGAMSATQATDNPGLARLAVAAGSIVGMAGHDGPVAVLPEMLDEMTKYDLETLIAATSGMIPGPSMNINVPCPGPKNRLGSCPNVLVRSLPWGYDSFFSLPPSSVGGLQSGG